MIEPSCAYCANAVRAFERFGVVGFAPCRACAISSGNALAETCPACGALTLAWPGADPSPLPPWAPVRGRLCGYCAGMWCVKCGDRIVDDDGPDLGEPGSGRLCAPCCRSLERDERFGLWNEGDP